MAKRDDTDWRQHVLNNVLPRMEANDIGAAGFQPGPANPQPLSFAGVNVSDFDVIELLPEGAQNRLRKLRQRSADANATTPKYEEIREASMARISAEQALTRLTNHPQQGGFGLKAEDRQVIAATKTVEKATADFLRLQELQTVRTAQWTAASQALAAVETWLKSAGPGGTTLEECEWPEPKLNKNETLLDGIARLQRRTRELRADAHRIRSACYTQAEAMALVSATVENWGSNCIDTSVTIEHLLQPTIPTKTVQAMVHNVPGAPAATVFVEVPDVAAILSTVLKDQFIAWLAADVDRNADPKGALSREAREQQEAVVMSDLLATERDICAFFWRGQADGLPVEFPGDTNPLALLGVKLVTTPRGETPGTSVEHAITFAGVRR